MRFMFGLVIASICFLLNANYAVAGDIEHENDTKFRSFLTDTVKSGDVIGLAVAVVRGGEVTLMESYGVRAFDSTDPIDTETVFRIASLSKAFAASAVSQLISDGRLSLSAPVSQFAPKLKLKNKNELDALTLEYILSHRTSLPPYAYDNLLESGIAPNRILSEFSKVDPICSVGRCYAYQNVAFDIAAQVIEQIEDRKYHEVIQRYFFTPLGMNRSSFGLNNLQRDENWARPHWRKRGGTWRVIKVKKPYYDLPAAGGVNASVSDMTQWLRAQMGHVQKVLSPEVLEMMQTQRVSTPAEIRRVSRTLRLESAHYGLGWRIYKYAGETIVNHAGNVDVGYAAQIAFLPQRDIGIVLLTNSRSRSFWEILPAFINGELSSIRTHD